MAEKVFDRWLIDWYENHSAVLDYFSGALAESLFF
jgi:hypothetical protein